MNKFKLTLLYSGFPPAWEEYKEAETDFIIDDYINQISKLAQAGTFYIQNQPNGFLKKLFALYNNDFVKNVKGVDFSKYFSAKFENQEQDITTRFPKFTFIYNVGLEPAVNKSFSTTLLKGLITHIKQQGSWALIVSDLTYTEFNKVYKIAIKNRFIASKDEEPVLSLS